MRFVFVCLTLVMLVGCAASGPLFSEKTKIPLAADGKSTVYVYRLDEVLGTGSGIQTPFFDNGAKMGTLSIGGYVSYVAEPGYHELLTETYIIDKLKQMEMQAGQTYYLRIDFEGGVWTGTFSITIVPEAEALPQISGNRYQGV
ncbi:MAG: DUF2846 domain-containing protein [Sneathiella sp.]